jgi:hypothetical protein
VAVTSAASSRSTSRSSKRVSAEPSFAPGHEHTEDCRALYREWRRYHALVQDTAGRFSRNEVLEAIHTRDVFGRQMQALGCSGEALRRIERDEEIQKHGHPLL